MSSDRVRSLLTAGLNEYERRLNARFLEKWIAAFLPTLSEDLDEGAEMERLMVFLKLLAERNLEQVNVMRKRHEEFVKQHSRALIAQERERHVLEFARDLGATPRELRGDRKAFRRWFGHDTVEERHEKGVHALERELALCLERMGALAETILDRAAAADKGSAWQSLALDQILKPLLAYPGDSRVSAAAFKCLARALRSIAAVLPEASVDQGILQFIYRWSLHAREDVWIQREALALLPVLSPEALPKVFEQRLLEGGGGEDDIFVRKRVVELLVENLDRCEELYDLLPLAARDQSPFVRQGFVRALAGAPASVIGTHLAALALNDPVPQVRAAGLLAAGELLGRDGFEETVLAILRTSFRDERDAFVLRVAIRLAGEGVSFLTKARHPMLAVWRDAMLADLERLHRQADAVKVRRWAMQERERIWCSGTPEAREVATVLEERLATLSSGESGTIPRRLLDPYPRELVGRVLAVLSQNDFGHEIEFLRNRARITRGSVFGFRWWRLLHELRHPSPDKRQAFPHTVGRCFRGSVRAPSGILGELTETKVPGEPFCDADEQGWRPYLPLPDAFLSNRRPFALYTSEGVTEVVPPATLFGRLRANLRLTVNFPRYARLRNWNAQSRQDPAAYLKSLERLGFVIRFRGHAEDDGKAVASDQSVQRFFSFSVPFAGGEVWTQFKEYFYSLYENSLFDLFLFTGCACALFMGRHWRSNRALRRARDNIPFVVGGWGTRGKSGTERLKAALFSALGYGIVCKTTGCEAMFLYSHPFGPIHEMFLYRPYDKATIWEQASVLDLASKLESDVFLWECMGLTPEYVDVLQRQWMRDDISTITNTYPDHEDVQGPAGFNIPEVMTLFIPEGTQLLTSEEHMLPILAEGARAKGCAVSPVTWLESGLLTSDIMERFPYVEHPSNLALVLAMADELGVERDFALKEMADRVVPDLGVLKTYPEAPVRGRRLQFSNGMSANDRHGALGNWTRLGFHRQDRYDEPGVWVTTVVNNRADRIPRSRMFARILVEDIAADRHYLIGNNLKGLEGYIREAWDDRAGTLTLWPDHADERPTAILEREARRLRLPIEDEHVRNRLHAMFPDGAVTGELAETCDALWHDPSALEAALNENESVENAGGICRALADDLRSLAEYHSFLARVCAAGNDPRPELDTAFRELLWQWFQRTIVVVDDYSISGDGLVSRIAEDTPPGYLNRIMGLQNIKGTGLDFVYRWFAWESCHRHACQLRDRDPTVAERGLRGLATFLDFGFLSEDAVRGALDTVRGARFAQSERFQAELAMIASNLEKTMAGVREVAGTVATRRGWLTAVLDVVEGFLEPGDSVKRRKAADRIYKDVVTGRISSKRAVAELKNLTQRQKGGWLSRAVESLRRKTSESAVPTRRPERQEEAVRV